MGKHEEDNLTNRSEVAYEMFQAYLTIFGRKERMTHEECVEAIVERMYAQNNVLIWTESGLIEALLPQMKSMADESPAQAEHYRIALNYFREKRYPLRSSLKLLDED